MRYAIITAIGAFMLVLALMLRRRSRLASGMVSLGLAANAHVSDVHDPQAAAEIAETVREWLAVPEPEAERLPFANASDAFDHFFPEQVNPTLKPTKRNPGVHLVGLGEFLDAESALNEFPSEADLDRNKPAGSS